MSQTDLPEGFDTAAVTTRIRRIWSQVLEVEHIEDRSNFFDLGGSSIDAILMLRMLHAELSATVELTDFFTMRTLHDLVIFVRRSLEEQNAVSS
jgi:acyl carrier protein